MSEIEAAATKPTDAKNTATLQEPLKPSDLQEHTQTHDQKSKKTRNLKRRSRTFPQVESESEIEMEDAHLETSQSITELTPRADLQHIGHSKASAIAVEATTLTLDDWEKGALVFRLTEARYITADPPVPLSPEVREYLENYCHGRIPDYARQNILSALQEYGKQEKNIQVDSRWPIDRDGIGSLLMKRELMTRVRRRGQEWWINDAVIMNYGALLQEKHPDCLVVPFTVYFGAWNSDTVFRSSYVRSLLLFRVV